MYTPLKINMESKNHPIEKESHLPNLDCLGSMLIFQGVYSYMSSTQNPGYSLYTRDYTTGMKPTQLYRDNNEPL